MGNLAIQIQIYTQTSIEPKYGAFYLKNKVSVPLQSLIVQLSCRVASFCNIYCYKKVTVKVKVKMKMKMKMKMKVKVKVKVYVR